MNYFASIIVLGLGSIVWAQHNNEFYNDGAAVTVQAGADVYIWGDLHNYQSSGNLDHNGFVEVQGNAYSDNLFQQRGTGTTLFINDDVNAGERQFISGSYAVRGGQASVGVDDGSFYDVELSNDQGIVYLVGNGNIADVRNSVDFSVGATVNRIVTHDIGMTGAITNPANGAAYTGVFGLMDPAAGLGGLVDNTVASNGNMSGVDNGYVQGRFRRAISPAGGNYGFVMGLEPAGAGAQRGMQYMLFDFGANNYDVLSGYFQTGLDNSFPSVVECSGYQIDYWGGVDHGQWVYTDINGTGAGTYEARVWPQDDNFPAKTVWLVTKDNSVLGTPDDCGPTPVGLDRAGFDGFSQFGVAAAEINILPAELIKISAEPKEDHIEISWDIASEINVDYYSLQRSENGMDFETIAVLDASGTSQSALYYAHDDYEVGRDKYYYYRYESMDFDMTANYSPVVSAKLTGEMAGFGDANVLLYPNPTSGNFSMEIALDKSAELEVAIMDGLGKILRTEHVSGVSGNNVYNVNTDGWSTGVYQLRVINVSTGDAVIKKIVKK